MVYIGSFLATAFFIVSLLLLVSVEYRRRAGVGAWVPDKVLVFGILLWVFGMFFDSARRVGSMESLRVFEQLLKFAGNLAITYSIFGTYRRIHDIRAGSGGVA